LPPQKNAHLTFTQNPTFTLKPPDHHSKKKKKKKIKNKK
jgi:hypothetical protein